ncbi:hypothetical protein YIM_17060 [Amycolatopsis sp. YIM 10]|nr:hypothetical protein YIM_17060 [Amycolatopsis sp. YIM 10]
MIPALCCVSRGGWDWDEQEKNGGDRRGKGAQGNPFGEQRERFQPWFDGYCADTQLYALPEG